MPAFEKSLIVEFKSWKFKLLLKSENKVKYVMTRGSATSVEFVGQVNAYY